MCVKTNVKEIVEAFNNINANPNLEKYVEVEEGRRFLVDLENVGDLEMSSNISILMSLLDSKLITSTGQHSETYYAIAESPLFRTRIFESDSFGPLVVGIYHKEKDYWVTYG